MLWSHTPEICIFKAFEWTVTSKASVVSSFSFVCPPSLFLASQMRDIAPMSCWCCEAVDTSHRAGSHLASPSQDKQPGCAIECVHRGRTHIVHRWCHTASLDIENTNVAFVWCAWLSKSTCGGSVGTPPSSRCAHSATNGVSCILGPNIYNERRNQELREFKPRIA